MKKITSLILIIMILISALSVSFTATAQELGANLIKNPSFDNTYNWAFGGIYTASDHARTWPYSAKSNARGVTVRVLTGDTINVKQNTNYLYSGYIYRNDNSTWAYIDMNDATGELQLLNTDSYGKWQYVAGVWNSGSSTTVTPRLVVEPNYTINQHLGTGITGDVWFDDISLQKITYSAYNETGTELPYDVGGISISNRDITAIIKLYGNKEYITQLKNNDTNYNWINKAQEVPMVTKCSEGTLDWNLDSFSSDDPYYSYVCTYSCNIEGLTLYSKYQIHGTGPVYRTCEIVNNTGRDITFNASDIKIADTCFISNSDLTLYRFNRSRYNNGFDGNFTKGVFENKIGKNAFFSTVTENSRLTNTGTLPFIMVQSNTEGLYMGYEWSYGESLLRTQQDPRKFRLEASFGYSDDVITRKNGETLVVPPVFFGVYSGDIDDGSNQMKEWFYQNLMTPTLRENANEPPIELHLPLFAENDLKGYLYDCDLEDWGVELTKMDYWWTVPGNDFDANLEQQWNPDKSKWPSGMTYGKLVKDAYPSVKTSLYMADTYQGVDIGTREGRELQLDALKTRLKNWEIDYWRSDFDLLKPNNYENHEGLMYILDELIKYDKDFRYEHCSAGGALKDFATLRRMTFMTMEDSGGALNHRMAFYSNSYMINPVQLKFDLGFDWTSGEDSSYINADKKEWYTYNVRTAMMGAMMVQNVSQRLNNDELDALKKGWSLYKEKQRPILKGCDVYHILPMPTGYSLDGMMFYNNDIDEGSVFIFRDKGGETAKTIKLRGLDENATYRLTFEDRTQLNCEKKGLELMESGIYVSGLNKAYDSEIIWIEKIYEDFPTEPSTEQTEVTTATEDTEVTTKPAVTTEPVENNTTSSTSTDPSETVTNPAPTETVEVTDATEPATTDAPIIIFSTTAIKVEPATTFTAAFTTVTEPVCEKVISGDTDLSGKVNIKDATLIQKALANLTELSYKEMKAADADQSMKINIKDATAIQKFLANIKIPFPIGEEVTI